MSLLAQGGLRTYLSKPSSDDPLVITPLLDASQVGAASVDVRLGHEFIVLGRSLVSHMDPTDTPSWGRVLHRSQEKVRISLFKKFVIHPGQLVLGATLEYICVPQTLAASVEGRSSWGRVGLIIATASTIAPGFKGCITLELINSGDVPLILYPGVRIAQLVFHGTEGSGDYGGKYACPTGPQFTRILGDPDIAFWAG